METFIFVMFEQEERESEIFVVRVLLSGFCWVDRSRFLAHTHRRIKHFSLAKQKHLHALQDHVEVDTTLCG